MLSDLFVIQIYSMISLFLSHCAKFLFKFIVLKHFDFDSYGMDGSERGVTQKHFRKKINV